MTIHSTAIIEDGVRLGEGTSVWDSVHIRRGALIGDECLIGEKTYIAYDVRIGDRVKINAMVYVCYGVTVEDGVMISAGTIFTNDRFPRATTSDLSALRPSDPDDETLPTLVKAGATIGAGCTIGSDLTIGRFAMVGMGSVVTRSIPDFHLALGNPARSVGAVCRCGQLLMRFDHNSVGRTSKSVRDGDRFPRRTDLEVRATCPTELQAVTCRCGLAYTISGYDVFEASPPEESSRMLEVSGMAGEIGAAS